MKSSYNKKKSPPKKYLIFWLSKGKVSYPMHIKTKIKKDLLQRIWSGRAETSKVEAKSLPIMIIAYLINVNWGAFHFVYCSFAFCLSFYFDFWRRLAWKRVCCFQFDFFYTFYQFCTAKYVVPSFVVTNLFVFNFNYPKFTETKAQFLTFQICIFSLYMYIYCIMCIYELLQRS